jgi:hypothetical protein
VPNLPNFCSGLTLFSDSQSQTGMPIIAKHDKILNLSFAINLNLTGAKLGPLLSTFVENGLLGKPNFPLQCPEGIHLQPALLTKRTYWEVDELARKEQEAL